MQQPVRNEGPKLVLCRFCNGASQVFTNPKTFRQRNSLTMITRKSNTPIKLPFIIFF